MNSSEIDLLTKIALVRDTWAYAALKKEGFSVKVFSEPVAPIFQYVEKHLQKHNDLPTTRTLTTEFPQLEGVIGTSAREEPLGILYEEVVEARKKESIQELLETAIQSYQDKEQKPDDSITVLQTGVEEIYNNFSTSGAESSTFADIIRHRTDELLGTKFTEPGLASPFLFIEDELGGYAPGEITAFLAKTSVGKSWALLQSAVTTSFGDPYHFYSELNLPADKKFLTPEEKEKRRGKVLVLSLEMSVMAISQRLLSLVAKVSFHRLKKGSLTVEESKKVTELLDSVKMNSDDGSIQILDNLKIIGPNTAHDPDTLNAAAEDFDADLVLIDGLYYMSGPGERRWEKIEANMQKLRLQTLRTNRHYILASQMKPASKTLQSSDGDSAAFSQSITQDSNNVMILVQEKNHKEDRQVICILDKARDGVSKIPYLYDWDHHECKYTELGLWMEEEESLESTGGII